MPPTRPDLKVIHEVPVGAITPHPENARRGDVAAIARSLARLGQYRPLVVSWRTGHVCAGNHTLAAAASLGWDTIKVGYVTATPAQERAILLADNRTADLGHYDDELLATLLALVPDPIDVGYDPAFLADALARADEVPWESVGLKVGTSINDRTAGYAASGLRSVLLVYELDEYAEVQATLAQLRGHYEVDNTSDAVRLLLADWGALR